MTPLESTLRNICQERCAEAGDPPCYELDRREGVPWTACSTCLAEAGEESPSDPIDPNAVIRPLF